MSQQGILLAASGSADPDGMAAFGVVEETISKAFPGVVLRSAFTAGTVRRKLEEAGRVVEGPLEALAGLQHDGVSQCFVQPLHVVPGTEYKHLLVTLEPFCRAESTLAVRMCGGALAESVSGISVLCSALSKGLPKARDPEEALIFVGHGSRQQEARRGYEALRDELAELAPQVFFGTVTDGPEQLVGELSIKAVKRACLVPLMLTVGYHVKHDIAGEQHRSWESALTDAGIESTTVKKGLAEYPDIVPWWIEQIEETLKEASP